MKQQVGVLQLLQSGVEGVHQMVGQLGDEAYGIRQDYIQIVGNRQLPGGGVQGVEKPVVGRNACPGELIQQGGFSGIGIAHNGHHRDGVFHSPLTLDTPNLANLFQLPFQTVDPLPDMAAVRFQLGFAGSPGADAAALPGQAGAHAGQPGQQIFILRQLHLKPAFPGLGSLGENVQNQGAAIQHRDTDDLFQRPDISRGQLIVKYHHGGRRSLHQHFYFQRLPFTDKAVGIGGMAVLQHLAGAEAPGSFQQGIQLLQSFLCGSLLHSKAVRIQSHQHGTLLNVFFHCCFHGSSCAPFGQIHLPVLYSIPHKPPGGQLFSCGKTKNPHHIAVMRILSFLTSGRSAC